MDFCHLLSAASWIAFDTEFVSEFNYYPDLCLVQVVASGGEVAIIDPKPKMDLDPFWDVLVAGDHQTIVHAGREEYRFCKRSSGAAPKNWFDIQLAAGLVGMEYPASYAKLVNRLLKKSLGKGETRTDWRRRPLSGAQLDYALLDVLYLHEMASRLSSSLDKLQREAWMREETADWMQRVDDTETREKWRKVSGSGNLPVRTQKIVKALWHWREQEAQHRDIPPRRVLRDDLLVEMARRGKTQPKDILAIRGINRRSLQDHVEDIAACIANADQQTIPKSNRNKTDLPPQADLIEKLLTTALAVICRQNSIAPPIVGTVQDVREMLMYELKISQSEKPALACGWRAEIVGNRFSELLAGQAALRVVDPNSTSPLAIEQRTSPNGSHGSAP